MVDGTAEVRNFLHTLHTFHTSRHLHKHDGLPETLRERSADLPTTLFLRAAPRHPVTRHLSNTCATLEYDVVVMGIPPGHLASSSFSFRSFAYAKTSFCAGAER